MAGGIGSRFWPISTAKFPKQFIDIVGNGSSLLQQTYSRFSKIIPNSNIFVVTSEMHKKIVVEQLPDIPQENILCEPMRRNTAPCIAYANLKIKLKNPAANVVVTPSDHYITNEEEFLNNITEGLKFVQISNHLLTLGIQPNRPATGYGYIQINQDSKNDKFLPVKTFTEKPHLELAKFFVNSGEFLWNSGIFIWKLRTIEKAFEDYLPEIYNIFYENIMYFNTDNEEDVLNSIYSDVKNISIDFGVMEKADNVFVLPADFDWSDLGTWNSLYVSGDKDEELNVNVCEQLVMQNSERNYINVAGKKVVVLDGVTDLVIVNTDDALLICKRENEENIKELLEQAKFKFGDDIVR